MHKDHSRNEIRVQKRRWKFINRKQPNFPDATWCGLRKWKYFCVCFRNLLPLCSHFSHLTFRTRHILIPSNILVSSRKPQNLIRLTIFIPGHKNVLSSKCASIYYGFIFIYKYYYYKVNSIIKYKGCIIRLLLFV